MTGITDTPAKQATRIIESVNDRLGGVLRILELVQNDDRPTEPDIIVVLMDAIGDAIDRLQEGALPLIDPPPSGVPRERVEA